MSQSRRIADIERGKGILDLAPCAMVMARLHGKLNFCMKVIRARCAWAQAWPLDNRKAKKGGLGCDRLL